MTRLSGSVSIDDDASIDTEVVVIGTGFGGSVAAASLAPRLGDRLLILERGREVIPGEFPQTGKQVLSELRSLSHPLGMFDMREGTDLDLLVSNVLGGGSQIYAGVTIPPDDAVFDAAEAGRRIWPRSLNGESLHPHYVRVMDRLNANPWPQVPAKAEQLHAFADEHGFPVKRPPLAINLTSGDRPACIGCGNCITGCNVNAKNTLNTNYLRDAADNGARIGTGFEARTLRPGSRRRWQLETVHHTDDEPRAITVHARMVILAAGTLGSTELLLRARRDGMPLSAALGTRLSGNGDDWCVAYRPSDRSSKSASLPGPTITSTAVVGPIGERVLVQDGAFPHAAMSTGRAIALLAGKFTSALRPKAPALTDSRVWLAMGADCPHGLAQLDSRGRLRVDRDRCIPLEDVRSDFLDLLARHHDAIPVRPPRPVPITVHPLGGCPASDGVEHGVVDADGAVYHPDGGHHEGLYVMDGSVSPTALGANPSLAIAALADRASQRLIARIR